MTGVKESRPAEGDKWSQMIQCARRGLGTTRINLEITLKDKRSCYLEKEEIEKPEDDPVRGSRVNLLVINKSLKLHFGHLMAAEQVKKLKKQINTVI